MVWLQDVVDNTLLKTKNGMNPRTPSSHRASHRTCSHSCVLHTSKIYQILQHHYRHMVHLWILYLWIYHILQHHYRHMVHLCILYLWIYHILQHHYRHMVQGLIQQEDGGNYIVLLDNTCERERGKKGKLWLQYTFSSPPSLTYIAVYAKAD